MGFADSVSEIRDTVSHEYLAERTVTMDFYDERSSSAEDYAYLFMCGMGCPAKFREMKQFLMELPAVIPFFNTPECIKEYRDPTFG